jgi:hypothetical protein
MKKCSFPETTQNGSSVDKIENPYTHINSPFDKRTSLALLPSCALTLH